jgi:hypothetical protein
MCLHAPQEWRKYAPLGERDVVGGGVVVREGESVEAPDANKNNELHSPATHKHHLPHMLQRMRLPTERHQQALAHGTAPPRHLPPARSARHARVYVVQILLKGVVYEHEGVRGPGHGWVGGHMGAAAAAARDGVVRVGVG